MADIVRENHSLDNIDYGGDQAVNQRMGGRPSDPWDAMEYGITLQAAQARYDSAQTPEARETVIRQLKAMAQQRAGLDTTNGRVNMAYAGKLPWHGLGVGFSGAMNRGEAYEASGQCFEVLKARLQYEHDGKMVDSDLFALKRSDNGKQLGSCMEVYQPFQNKEAYDLLDWVMEGFGATYETAGCLHGGEKCWVLAHLPAQSFDAQRGDRIEAYALVQLDHTGKGATLVIPTSARVVCANTLRVAVKGQQGKGIRLTHKGDLKAKVAEVQRALGMSVTAMASFAEQAQSMVAKQVNPVTYFNTLLDEITDFPSGQTVDSMLKQMVDLSPMAVEVARDLLSKRKQKRDQMYQQIMRMYESSRCSPKGSAWAAFNAVTDWADHSGKSRSQDSRFEACLEGKSDDVKQLAFQLAV